MTSGYFLIIRLAALFNGKAKKWVEGREGIFEKLEKDFQFQKNSPSKVIWMHCASLGEFEQGRTVLERLKKERPEIRILLTFFSPSGYEIRKNYKWADWVYYLPADSRENADRFLATVRPVMAIFIKNEFWYFYLKKLKQLGVPVILIAAFFSENHIIFKPYGHLYREMLFCFDKIFTQEADSNKLLKKIGYEKSVVAGDPRVDRVLEIAGEKKGGALAEKFCGQSPVLIGGSTWRPDEEILSALLRDDRFARWKLIIAPHDVSAKRIEEVQALFGPQALLWSEWSEEGIPSQGRVLIIDTIGLLASLYRYGTLAYIGGGFGRGIHNTLEPMAFNLPVVYGPRYRGFAEARTMARKGGHFPINNVKGLPEVMALLNNEERMQKARCLVSNYMQQNKGATTAIISHLEKYWR